MYMRKYLLVIFLLLSYCSVIDEDAFYSKAIGTYTLTTTGTGFILREMDTYLETGTCIEFRGDGTLVAVTNTLSYTIATFVKLEKKYQGLFKLSKTGEYVAMGYESSLWISTTNAESDPSKVLFEHLVPIATKN